MDPPPLSDHDKINDQKEAGPSFHCDLYDTQLAHKISLLLLPGLSTASVDNTTGDLFKTPGSVASDIKTEMITYLNHRSETFVADHILLQGGNNNNGSSEITEPPHDNDPYDVVSSFVDDFAASKRNLFSRVSNWLLSERREDNIDDFAQEMEASGGFWLTDHIAALAQTLLKNVDFKGLSHCERKFQTQGELAAHVLECGYRTMDCLNEGCGEVFCANQRESHDSVCQFKMIPCEQGCSERSVMRREMDRHCITVCSMKLVNCAFRGVGCLADVRQCEAQRHFVDGLGSHLVCVLRSLYREASVDDLKPRAEQIQQLSTGLSEARNVRALTNLVKEIDAKLGDLVIKPKNKPDDKENEALEEAEIKEKPETAVSLEQPAKEKTQEDEVVSREVDDAKVGEVVKKVSDAKIAENVNEEGESKAQKLLEMGEFIKEGDNNSAADLSESTETKAPEAVVIDKEKEENPETKQTRTNETRGVETGDSDRIDEENHKETKISAETKGEAPSTIAMEKEENEEGAATKQTTTDETKGVETEVNDVIDQENNKETKIAADETKSEAPSRIVMEKEENEEGAETKQTTTNETKGVETGVNDKIDKENRETKIPAETKSESPSRIVTDKEENKEGVETINSSASASDEAEALSKSSEAFSKAQAETEPNFS